MTAVAAIAALGRNVGSILKRTVMNAASPIARLGDASPRALAERLLDEIAEGHVPVWPSTERFADRLVDGLRELQDERGREVFAAIARAPRGTAIAWRDLLRPLIT